MTTPKLSIITTEEIGRVYQMPNGEFAEKISGIAARRGLEAGSLFPSITNVISAINPDMEGYVAYMCGQGLREGMDTASALKNYITFRDNAGARGTRVHKFIEDFIEAGFADKHYLTFMAQKSEWQQLPSYVECLNNHMPYGDLNHIKAFFGFIKDYSPRFINQEATVYGTTKFGQAYAGTTDFIAEIGGKVIVGDWKTSSKMSGTVALQLSAVINADKMTTDMETLVPVPHIDEAWGIHIAKDGSYGVYVAKDTDKAFESFSAARTIWDFYINKKSVIDKKELV